MSYERFEGRVTMYLVMAIYIHLTRDIWFGIFGMLVIVAAVVAALFLTAERLDTLKR